MNSLLLATRALLAAIETGGSYEPAIIQVKEAMGLSEGNCVLPGNSGIEKYIEVKENGGKKDFHFKPNGKYLGFAYREVDGYYVFVFEEGIAGAWSGYVLNAIGETLDQLNSRNTQPPSVSEVEQAVLWHAIIVEVENNPSAIEGLMKLYHISEK